MLSLLQRIVAKVPFVNTFPRSSVPKPAEKGAYIRKFLTEDEYSSMLQKQEEHLIKIKRQAIVQKGNLRYIPPPDRLDRRRERDIL